MKRIHKCHCCRQTPSHCWELIAKFSLFFTAVTSSRRPPLFFARIVFVSKLRFEHSVTSIKYAVFRREDKQIHI